MKPNTLVSALLCSLAVLGWTPPLRAAPSPITPVVEPDKDEGISTEYAVGSALIGGFNVATILNNTGDHGFSTSARWGYLGVLSGALGLALGGVGLAEDRSNKENDLAVANLIVGGVAGVAGVLAVRRAKRDQHPPAAAIRETPVHLAAGVIRGHQQGVGVQLTF